MTFKRACPGKIVRSHVVVEESAARDTGQARLRDSVQWETAALAGPAARRHAKAGSDGPCKGDDLRHSGPQTAGCMLAERWQSAVGQGPSGPSTST